MRSAALRSMLDHLPEPLRDLWPAARGDGGQSAFHSIVLTVLGGVLMAKLGLVAVDQRVFEQIAQAPAPIASSSIWEGFPEPAADAPVVADPVGEDEAALPIDSHEAAPDALASLRPEPLLEERLRLQRLDESLRLREVALTMNEERVNAAIDRLEALKAELEAVLATLEEQAASDLSSLVEIYAKMKPKEAAAIFNDLGDAELLYFTRHMPANKLGPIFAKMNVDRVTAVTETVAGHAKRFVAD